MAQGLPEILVFEVAGLRFGLPGNCVRELLRAVFITPLPRSSRAIEGVINVRGKVLPVLDLRHYLGLPAKAVEPADHFLVIGAGDRLLAVRVDRALELARLETAAVDEANLVPGIDDGAPVAKSSEGLVPLLDLQTFLAQREWTSLAETLAASSVSSAGEGRQP